MQKNITGFNPITSESGLYNKCFCLFVCFGIFHLQKIKSLVMCQLHEATSFMPLVMCQLNKPLISVCFTKPLAYTFKPQYQFQYTGQLYNHRKLLNTYIKSCILYLYYSNSQLFFIYHWSKNLKEMPPL